MPLFQPTTITQIGTGAITRTIINKINENFSVKDFGALGDGTTDDTVAIQAAITAANAAGGGTVFFPSGTYKATSTINMATKVSLNGTGKKSSVISWNSLSDGLAMTSTINSSTAVNIKISNLGLTCTNGSNTGAGYADVGGTYWLLEGVRILGFKFNVILDQSELADINDCDFESSLIGAVWLVNGPDHTGGANAGFTNRISINRCQFGLSASTYGIIDDGGYSHSFRDNNYNGGVTHIRSVGAHACLISGGEFESASGSNIILTGGASSQFFGGTVGPSTAMTIESCQLTPTSGQSTISIVSQGKLSVIGCAFGGSGTPAAITGLTSCSAFYGAGNYNLTESGTATIHFSNGTTAANIKGTVTLNSLTASQAVVTDASKNLASLAYTNANTVSTLVQRDSSGNFSAGTITASLTGNATNVSGTVAIGNGGTGQITKAAAFDALSPLTTGGDLLYGGASGTGTRLANGTSNYVLTSAGGTAAPTWTNPAAVAARYYTISGQSITNSGAAVIIDFNTKDYDNSNNVSGSGSSWVFTAPTAGLYYIHSTVWVASAAWTAGNVMWLAIMKNGTEFTDGKLWYGLSVTSRTAVEVTDTLSLAANDTIAIAMLQNRTGGAVTLDTATTRVNVEIRRVGT